MAGNTPRLDTERLRQFLLVSASDSFTDAGAELGLPQPAVSQLIRNLEVEFGAALGIKGPLQLFDRGKRPMRLTPAGATLQKFAQELGTQTEDLVRRLGAVAQGDAGLVKLGTARSVAGVLLPEAIVRVKRQYPDISIDVYEGDSSAVIEMVAQGSVDFGLCSVAEGGNLSLETKPLYVDRAVLAVPVGHRLAKARKSPVTVADLALEPLMLVRKDQNALHGRIEAAFAREDVFLNPIVEGGSVDILLQLVARHIGLTFVPELNARLANYLEGKVRFVPFVVSMADPRSIAVEAIIVWRPSQFRTPAAQHLEAALVAEAAELSKLVAWQQ